LEPLPLFERGLHPQVCGTRQNAFCEGQDALYVEFFELSAMTTEPNERGLLAQFLRVAVVGLDVDRTFEEEGLIQAHLQEFAAGHRHPTRNVSNDLTYGRLIAAAERAGDRKELQSLYGEAKHVSLNA
jgi:hypothetical protein